MIEPSHLVTLDHPMEVTPHLFVEKKTSFNLEVPSREPREVVIRNTLSAAACDLIVILAATLHLSGYVTKRHIQQIFVTGTEKFEALPSVHHGQRTICAREYYSNL